MPGNRPLLLLTLSGSLIFPLSGHAEAMAEDPDSPFLGAPSDWLDTGIAWCMFETPTPDGGQRAPGEESNILVTADGAVLNQSEETALFSGDVEVNYQEAWIRAQEIRYHRRSETIEADQSFVLLQPGLRVAGSRAQIHLAEDQGNAEAVEYRLPTVPARGSAASVEILDPDHFFFEQPTYTTCPPGDSSWELTAADLSIDTEEGVGTAHDAKLRFKGVPFLYLPYASFPIDDRRKSGFLPPSVGQSESTGFDLSVPYYFNIAPNMDATLAPRIMTKRGLALGGEFRYMQPRHRGVLLAEILPDDRDRSEDDPDVRGAFSLQGQATPGDDWLFETDINYVSDDNYLADLRKSMALTSKKHLERHADLRYSGERWALLGRVQDFQTIAQNTEEPYSRLPQLLAKFDSPITQQGLSLGLTSEYVYFDHDDKERGHRLDIHPYLTLPMEREWGFLTPKLSGRYTAYQLDQRATGLPDDPDRLLGSFSLDGGLFFERYADWFGNDTLQTLEPRLFYLYTPYKDQSDLPVFDSADTTFSFNSLFRANRFSGSDRVGDANQLTTALSSRILDSRTNRELLSASLGQIFYFADREVQLEGSSTTTESSSPIVAEVSAILGGGWSARGNIQWDPHASVSRTERSAASIHYLDKNKGAFNLAYRYLEDELEDTEVSVHVPVNDSLGLMGLWNYSLLRDQTMGAFAGIEYNSCCWTVRAMVRQFVTDGDEDPELDFFVQLELKGLASLGSRLDDTLKREIRGYDSD